MTVINIVVESKLSGSLSGYQSISIDDSRPVQEVIDQYCEEKGTSSEPYHALITKSNLVLVNKRPISDFFISDGEILQLTQLRRSSRLAFRQWLTMSGIGMFVAVVGFIACILLYAVFRNVPDNYAMVIDAGSTHTDMILYSWPGHKRNNTGEVTQVHLCSASGGIAQVSPENISSYFEPCFSEAYNAIKEDSKSHREVLFGATAGMRLLNQTDPATSAKVISVVRDYIQHSEWTYKEPNVGIITGYTEGVSGWITLNFLNKTVLNKGNVTDTFGALDLGGASTQISIEVNSTFKDAPNVYPITLFGNKFYIFSQSFLCHGVIEALRRYRAILLTEQPNSTFLASPCEPTGWNITLKKSYFKSACTDFIETETTTINPIVISGTADYAQCQRVTRKLLNYTECSKMRMGNCVDSSQFPSDLLTRDYYAFAAFSYIIQDLGLSPQTRFGDAEFFIKRMCEYSVNELHYIKKKSSNRKRKFEQLCFEAQYMLTLLSQVYGFTSDLNWMQITFANRLHDSNLGWSLGYMVNATEEIAAGPPVPTLKVVPFSLLTVLCVIFAILSIAFVVHGFKVRSGTPGYHSSKVPSQKSVNSVL